MTAGDSGASNFLYTRIYEELKTEIRSGRYRKGDWFPPERQLKERFNTTHLTVRNALSKLVLEGYIERYSGKGTLVIYDRDRREAPRRQLSLRSVHFLVESLREPTAELLARLEERLRALGLTTSFACHRGDPHLERGLYAESRGAETLVVLEPAHSEHSLLFSGQELGNTVVINADSQGCPVPRVVPDYGGAAQRATTYLLESGHGLVGHIAGGLSLAAAALQEGYRSALEARGLSAPETLSAGGGDNPAAGAAACRRILEAHPDCRAFFCSGPAAALGALRHLGEEGLRPGLTTAVIAYGSACLAEAAGLSTVDAPPRALCDELAAVIEETMRTGSSPPRLHRVGAELFLRRTA